MSKANAIKLQTTIDEATVQALPALRPLLGQRVELIALPDASTPPRRKLTLDELLARRVDAPAGSKALSVEDIEEAIAQGALDGNV